MTFTEMIFASARLAAMLAPALLTSRTLRVRMTRTSGSAACLIEAVLAVSLLLLAAELLGVLSLLRFWPLEALLAVIAAATWAACRSADRGPTSTAVESVLPAVRAGGISAVVAVVVLVAQWLSQTADALGGGMYSFDTLWYHMPFAAAFFQSASITHIQFTQADAFTAYYPANAELIHALGMIATGNDVLSPELNLGWLALALLAAWCAGARWQIERLTLCAGALAISLPVLGWTQPGQAFNDIAGLATLLAGLALFLTAQRSRLTVIAGGLALGFAAGTKYTFIAPAAVLTLAWALRAARGRRLAAFGLSAGTVALSGGYWYLRDLIAVGNPFGLSVQIGPLRLGGPVSPLASAAQQSVLSQIGHLSLWSSRFAPGLEHALGPLWPVILVLYLGAILFGCIRPADRDVQMVAFAAGVAGLTYLVLPNTAESIQQGSALFEVNLRYATPALMLGLVLVPILVRLQAPRLLAAAGPMLTILLLAGQLEHALLPTQTTRHLAFIVATALVLGIVRVGRGYRPATAGAAAMLLGATLLVGVGAAYAVQRHYFARRYRVARTNDPGLAVIYRWAQSVEHQRIGLYGTVEQYPLYGARDTNIVVYLGVGTRDGGYRPITSCAVWRRQINAGSYRYVVLTPGPTTAVPVSWTASDPAVALVLHPVQADYVFRISGPLNAHECA